MVNPVRDVQEIGIEGNQFFIKGQYLEAIAQYHKALLIDPQSSSIYFNCALAYQAMNDLPRALYYFDQAILHQADYADAYLNRGNILRDLHQLERARQSYETAIQYAPEMVQAFNNLGVVLYEERQLEKACHAFENAILKDPQHTNSHWGLSLCHLLLGDFQKGWQGFEWRLQDEHFVKSNFPKEFASYLWKKGESIQGKTMLLMAEQGLGDTIQFCRFAKNLHQLGAQVVLQVPDILQTLLTNVEGVDQVLAASEQAHGIDLVVPLMSIPYMLDLDEKDFHRDVYLRVDPQKMRQWQPIIQATSKIKIGLVWQGGVRESMPQNWATHQRRNMPFNFFEQLYRQEITFFNLQKGHQSIKALDAYRKDFPDSMFQLQDVMMDDFSDTAAIISQLDLVITVDTSVAHLAGALGKPVWVLNRFDACWRWLLNRTDTTWYPSMRLYFQEAPGDWQSAIHQVVNDLDQFISARK